MSPQTNPVPEVLIVTFSIAFCWVPVFIGLKLLQVCRERLRERHERRHPTPPKPPPPRPLSALWKGKGVDAGRSSEARVPEAREMPATRLKPASPSPPTAQDPDVEQGLHTEASPYGMRFVDTGDNMSGQPESYRSREMLGKQQAKGRDRAHRAADGRRQPGLHRAAVGARQIWDVDDKGGEARSNGNGGRASKSPSPKAWDPKKNVAGAAPLHPGVPEDQSSRSA